MSLNLRISKIIEYASLTPSEFADEIDVQRSSISHITAGRNKPSLDFLIKVKDRFPELEWDWIISGKGEMIKTENTAPTPLSAEEQKAKPISTFQDLFSLIEEEEQEEENVNQSTTLEIQNPKIIENVIKSSELNISAPSSVDQKINDSQRLEIKEDFINTQKTDNEEVKIKKIVMFFDNGKFESFEP